MADVPDRRRDDDGSASRRGYAGFQVTGKDPTLWARLRPQLLAQLEQVIEGLTGADQGLAWLQSQAQDFTNLALDHVRAKLRKAGVEVQQIEAEVTRIYAERERIIAETRKTHAQARAIEIDNKVKDLQLALGLTRAMLIGEEDETAILFGRQIEAMLDAIRAVTETEGTSSST